MSRKATAARNHVALETKEAGPGLPLELKTALDGFNKTVADFKAANDERIKGIEKKFDDVVTNEKVDKINAAVEELKSAFNDKIAELSKAAKSASNDNDEIEAKAAELLGFERKAFDTYLRRGDHEAMRAAVKKADELELKDLSTVIAEDGGYMVLPEYEADMIDIILETSPIRQIANVKEIGSNELKIPVNKKGATAAWVSELATRNATDTSNVEQVSFKPHEIYALPLVTLSMLEDAEFDVEQWLTEDVTEAMVNAENTAFVNGDGNGKPRGFLNQTIVADASWAWGKIGYIASGASGAFAGSGNGADALINLVYAFKAALRPNLDWVGNKGTLAAIRKIKDGDGNYIFKDAITESGLVTRVLGYGFTEAEDMPAMAADSYSLALGNFDKGYLITDRIGLQVRRDEVTAPGFVKFHFRRRTGGDVRDYQAIKVMKFATS